MGSLDRQARRLVDQIEALEGQGSVARLVADRSWPAARSLVLADQVALELGNPAVGSLSATLWTGERLLAGGAAYRLGPDVGTGLAPSRRFGQLALVSGSFSDEYSLLLDLQDALCDVALEGVTLRARPSAHGVWYRVSRDALARGFSLAHLAGALLEGLESVEGVEAATVLFLADGGVAWPASLRALADEASRVTGALVKRSEVHERECDVCDFADLCDEAEGL